MLAIVVLAGLLPDTGLVSASSSCSYGKCPAAQPFPLWAVSASVAVVIIALIAALLLLRRSRRRPPPAGAEEAGVAGGTAAGSTEGWSETPEGTDGQSQAWSEDANPETDGSSEAPDPSGDEAESPG